MCETCTDLRTLIPMDFRVCVLRPRTWTEAALLLGECPDCYSTVCIDIPLQQKGKKS